MEGIVDYALMKGDPETIKNLPIIPLELLFGHIDNPASQSTRDQKGSLTKEPVFSVCPINPEVNYLLNKLYITCRIFAGGGSNIEGLHLSLFR